MGQGLMSSGENCYYLNQAFAAVCTFASLDLPLGLGKEQSLWFSQVGNDVGHVGDWAGEAKGELFLLQYLQHAQGYLQRREDPQQFWQRENMTLRT